MPTQQIPVVGSGVVSRRHAKLLHHLFQANNNAGSGNAPVKDLRIRRVVPPASSAPPPDAYPDPPALAKPKPVPAVQIQIQVQVQSTPPEPTVAAAEDRERKPTVLPRSKLVRDPASFGYRRLLPFLNQMAANNNGSDISDSKDAPSEPKVPVSANKELSSSDSGLANEPVDGGQSGAVPANPVDSVEPVALKAGEEGERKDCSDTVVREEDKVVPADPASSKPCVTRCARSKFVHHPSSFSYKRMLPFLRENDISSQEEDRAKIRRVSEEEHITSDENRVVEEMPSISDGNRVEQIQSAVAEVSLDASSTAEVQRATQEVLASVADPISSEKGELTSGTSAVLVGGQRQLAVSEDSLEKRNPARAETTVEEKASRSDEKSVLMDFLEPLVAKAGGDQETKDRCDSVKEQTNIPQAASRLLPAARGPSLFITRARLATRGCCHFSGRMKSHPRR